MPLSNLKIGQTGTITKIDGKVLQKISIPHIEMGINNLKKLSLI